MHNTPIQKRQSALIPYLVISFLFTFAISPPDLSAVVNTDEGTNTIQQLEQIVVTATRGNTPRENVSANVTVITRAEIEKLPVTNLSEVLRYISGVHVESAGGPGSFAVGLHIQGSETRQVAIYQDGVPLNELDNPRTDLSYLPIDVIERIEVYKGAASSAWGSALGGVINIITRNPNPKKSFSADMIASYGEFETLKTRVGFNGTVERFGYLLSITHDESNGFVKHTEYEHDALYLKLHYDVGRTARLSAALLIDDGENADPVINPPGFWDDIDRKRRYQRLLFETELHDGWALSLEGRHHQWDIHIDDVFPDFKMVYNDYEDETWGGSARLTYQKNARHSFNLGFDGNHGKYDWIHYDRTYDTDIWAFYINDTLRLGNFSINAGVRYDDDSTFGDEISPVLGAVYHLWKNKARIRFQVARGFSAPPAAWVQDPVYGNSDLNPETAVSYQLGGEIVPFAALKFEWNLFRSAVDDFINFNFPTMRYENIDKVVRQGVESTVTAILPIGLTVSFSGSYVDVRNDKTDKIITDIPRTLYSLQVTHCYKRLTHTLAGTYNDHNSSFPETEDRKFIFNYRFNIDLSCKSLTGRPDLFGAIYNVGDTHHIYRDVWPKPRRWVEMGMRFRF